MRWTNPKPHLITRPATVSVSGSIEPSMTYCGHCQPPGNGIGSLVFLRFCFVITPPHIQARGSLRSSSCLVGSPGFLWIFSWAGSGTLSQGTYRTGWLSIRLDLRWHLRMLVRGCWLLQVDGRSGITSMFGRPLFRSASWSYLRDLGVRGRHKLHNKWSSVVYQVLKAPSGSSDSSDDGPAGMIPVQAQPDTGSSVPTWRSFPLVVSPAPLGCLCVEQVGPPPVNILTFIIFPSLLAFRDNGELQLQPAQPL
uniref:uncharacterized protein LOC131136324 n=1 Tax=Doryrhamphus excisus TaxID=161450 RepID=UPI0025AE0209|nr:uncharacterized protein LOC131136324 [Doryrhamphus excisus]